MQVVFPDHQFMVLLRINVKMKQQENCVRIFSCMKELISVQNWWGNVTVFSLLSSPAMAGNRDSTNWGEAEDKPGPEEGAWKGDIETHISAETGGLVGILKGFQPKTSTV